MGITLRRRSVSSIPEIKLPYLPSGRTVKFTCDMILRGHKHIIVITHSRSNRPYSSKRLVSNPFKHHVANFRKWFRLNRQYLMGHCIAPFTITYIKCYCIGAYFIEHQMRFSFGRCTSVAEVPFIFIFTAATLCSIPYEYLLISEIKRFLKRELCSKRILVHTYIVSTASRHNRQKQAQHYIGFYSKCFHFMHTK